MVLRSAWRRGGLGSLACAIPAWWLGLFVSEPFRDAFIAATRWSSFRSLLWADLGLALVTLLAALEQGSTVRNSRWRTGACLGGWLYATLWTVGAWSVGEVTWLGAVAMLLAFVLVGGLCDVQIPPRPPRES